MGTKSQANELLTLLKMEINNKISNQITPICYEREGKFNQLMSKIIDF